jgi:ABC-type multidrug transport system fused ATPase/permease subunit
MTERTGSWAGWRLLVTDLGKRRRALAWLAAWSVVESLPALASGVCVASALDQGFLAHRPLVGLSWLGLLGATMLVGAVATRATFRWLPGIVEPLRNLLVTTVVAGALHRAAHNPRGDDSAAVARLSGQAETVRNLVAALLRTLRSTVMGMVLAVVGLFALAPIVAGITVPLVVASLVLFCWSMRTLAARHRAMLLAGERMAQTCTQVFDGVRDVVACGAVPAASDSVVRSVRAEARAQFAIARASSSRTLILAVGCHLPVVLLLSLAPWLYGSGWLSAGELVGATTYLVGALNPALRAVTGTIGGWGRQLSVLLHRIHETSAPPVEPTVAHDRARLPASYDIAVSGLTFAYGPHALPVIDNLSLDIAAGEHLAVVGPSGIGKSTLAALVVGLVSPQAGTVRLGGVPVLELPAPHLRQMVAMVPQEAYVFSGTLRENIAYLHADVTDEEIVVAVTALGITALVERLGGYDAQLGMDGPDLSAGEKQLVALTRAYVSSAHILVLDEATCHLDPAAEARVETALADTGRTLIVIAHRISSARRAGRILLLDGTAARLGTHDELVRTSSRYAELVGHWETGVAPMAPSGSSKRLGVATLEPLSYVRD